jgi:Archaeal/vacuolar-type H+-ATPase subunit E
MTGLEKIIQKIEQDYSTECDGILSKAKLEAASIIEKAGSDAKLIAQEILDTAARDNERDVTFVTSKAELDSRKGLLSVKIDIVNSIIQEALRKLKSLPDAEYFKTVETLVLKYAQNGSGILCFSKRDLDRLPKGFEAELNKALAGRTVKISDKSVNIDGGFVLVYDDIEQNCSFDALLASSIDEVKDALYEKLFKRESL